MKRNAVLVVVMAAVVVIVAGAGYWFSQRSAWAYQGMASHFPEKAQAFVEITQLGQWMPASEAGAAATPAQVSRGTDPMLQVLKTVWAAPVVTAKDLPELLRSKPMAAAVWLEGSTLKGAALMPLVPGEKAAVEQALKEKLGDSPVVETVAGIALHKVEIPDQEEGLKVDQVLWGVGDSWAIFALGADGAKEVLTVQGKTLAEDGSFLAGLKRFPGTGGAHLFVRGTLMEEAAKANSKGRRAEAPADDEDAPPATGSPSGKEAPAQTAPTGDSSPEEPFGKALRGLAKDSLPKLLSMQSIESLVLWTAPPKDGEKGWQVESWLGFKDQPQGIWRLAAQGSAKTPQICGRVPKNGQVYVWGAGRDPARLYQDILDELGRDLPAEQMSWVRAAIGAAEGKLGLSFSNDLLPAISDEWCFVSARATGPGSGEQKNGDGMGQSAVFITLRDARRFEDLVNSKLAPQLKLVAVDFKGARGWAYGDGSGKSLSLLISGGMAIFTQYPAWALDTGGTPGKAWKAFSEPKEKACAWVIADPSLWSEASETLMSVSCESGPEGIFVSGRFPGRLPEFGKGTCCDKPCDEPCDGEKEAPVKGRRESGAI